MNHWIKLFASLFFQYLGGVYLIKLFVRKQSLFITLNYHNFSKYNNYKSKRGSILETGYSENFDKQIQFLRKHFSFKTPSEFFCENSEKGLNVFLTFDDGYKDNFDIALPVLTKHRAKAAFFVVTNIIGSNEWLSHDKIRYLVVKGELDPLFAENCLKEMNSGIPLPKQIIELVSNYKFPTENRLMMNWNELRIIQENGFYVQPHTHSHAILSFLEANDQKCEVENSINFIQKNLGVSSENFAYPNGLYNDRTLKILKNHKIKFAFTTKQGVNNKHSQLLELKRIGINASDSIGVLSLKILLNLRK